MDVRLAIIGSRKFYDFGYVEAVIDAWITAHGHPVRIICGGASGVDEMARRYADNHNIPVQVIEAIWRGDEAEPDLMERIVNECTHVLALPGVKSKWTLRTIELAKQKGRFLDIRRVSV